MLSTRGTIMKDGDVVLVFHGHNDLRPMTLKAGTTLTCKAGRFPHDNFIGRKFGSRIEGDANERAAAVRPKLIALQPSADLWTIAVPHRTQIIYATDIATILLNCRIKPGSVIVEAGTGSGSLSHSFARSVAPNGRLYTFDFHQGRAAQAREEFARNGLGHVITNGWRDACSTNTEADGLTGLEEGNTAPIAGFGLPQHSVDAVFLDLPAPWAAVENVLHVLKPDGIICTFSPCIEQTQRLCDRLREDPLDFVDVRTVEALTRYYEPVNPKRRRMEYKDDANNIYRDEDPTADTIMFKPEPGSKGHSAYLTFARRRLAPTEFQLSLDRARKAHAAADAAAAAATTAAPAAAEAPKAE